MRYALMTEPQQGYSYQDIVDAANAAKTAGFETYFRSDHYSSFPGKEDLPTSDCWTTLAGLVRDTSGIGVGSMVSPVTFRIPGSLAKVVATVVEMAGDERVELGVGAGWNEGEHAALGIPYPGTVDRVDRLEEQLAILRGLWDEPDGWSFEGRHYQVRGALFRPRGPRPNLIVGGDGKPRSSRLGAQYADEYNISSSNPAEVREIMARLDAACEKQDRDPATLTRSVMAGVLVGRDEAEFQARREAQVAIFGGDDEGAADWMEARKDRWIWGTPEQARQRIAEYADTGVDRLLFQDFLPHDLDHIAVMGELIS
ncbi:MAG: LLM class flavin-dependent oxidoreductase [Chloroflexota bacterium]|jgi:alkanesulfonate monooxygenase SsuD/methylene tetrahydromethanopterin reductase-like flavin-dependent oxidoreductase (luciferase family)